MSHKNESNKDQLLPEFGVTRRELGADVKARVASLDAGQGLTAAQLREKLNTRRSERNQPKKIQTSR